MVYSERNISFLARGSFELPSSEKVTRHSDDDLSSPCPFPMSLFLPLPCYFLYCVIRLIPLSSIRPNGASISKLIKRQSTIWANRSCCYSWNEVSIDTAWAYWRSLPSEHLQGRCHIRARGPKISHRLLSVIALLLYNRAVTGNACDVWQHRNRIGLRRGLDASGVKDKNLRYTRLSIHGYLDKMSSEKLHSGLSLWPNRANGRAGQGRMQNISHFLHFFFVNFFLKTMRRWLDNVIFSHLLLFYY